MKCLGQDSSTLRGELSNESLLFSRSRGLVRSKLTGHILFPAHGKLTIVKKCGLSPCSDR